MGSLSSTLKGVTIYREGALCTRLARVEPGTGRQLRFGGLPLALEPGSLRAKLTRGPDGLRVLDVRPQFDVELADEVNVPEERKALEAAQRELERLTVRRDRLEAEISELANLRPRFLEPGRGEPPREAPVDAMLALAGFTDAHLAPRLEERRALERQLEDARRELDLRQRRLDEASTARRTERARLSRVAVVTLSGPVEAAAELEIEYLVPGARWAPTYALRLKRGMTRGTLEMRASVAQATGEDWSGVARAEGRSPRAARAEDWPPAGAAAPHWLARTAARPRRTLRVVRRRDAWAAAAAPLQARTAEGRAPRAAVAADGRATSARRGRHQPGRPPRKCTAAAASSDRVRAYAESGRAADGEVGGARRVGRASPGGGLLDEEDGLMLGAPARTMEFEDPAELEGGGGADDTPVEPEPAAAMGIDESLLDYGSLVMMGVSDAHRGRLRPGAPLDFASAAGISVQVNVVLTAVSRAQSSAVRVRTMPLPSNCREAGSVDHFDYRFDCAAPVDVPSTGTWTTVPVMTCDVGLTPEYVCVPSVEPHVYRTLLLANRSAHALLPGPVDVTLGDQFLLTTTLPAIPPGASATKRLGLGVEEAIKVARKTQFKETTGGILGGSTLLPHDIEIEVNNRLGSPALIEIRERVPYPAPEEKDLTVEETQVSPRWEAVDEPIDGAAVRGARRWRVTVPAGQSMKLSAQFVIRMPGDKMLVGGNRRA